MLHCKPLYELWWAWLLFIHSPLLLLYNWTIEVQNDGMKYEYMRIRYCLPSYHFDFDIFIVWIFIGKVCIYGFNFWNCPTLIKVPKRKPSSIQSRPFLVTGTAAVVGCLEVIFSVLKFGVASFGISVIKTHNCSYIG